MSITGAIFVGAGLGKAASNLIFKYEKKLYEDAIIELERLVKELDNSLKKLREYRAQVHIFWVDEDGQKVSRALDETINKIVFNMDKCNLLIQTYQEVIAEFGIGQTKITNLIEDAMGILVGISG